MSLRVLLLMIWITLSLICAYSRIIIMVDCDGVVCQALSNLLACYTDTHIFLIILVNIKISKKHSIISLKSPHRVKK